MVTEKDIYGHNCLHREEYMMRPQHNTVSCGCNNSNSAFNNITTSVEGNCCNSKIDHHCNHRIRIRFVGFVYDNINYIVNLDDKEVIYKSLVDLHYRRLSTKVCVETSSVSKSYALSFRIKADNIVAKVEVFPNCITHYIVELTDTCNHSAKILDKEYTAVEYFQIRNMLDDNLNIITFCGYSDLFALTQDDLMNILSLNDATELIKGFLDNINCGRDVMYATKEFLALLKKKYQDHEDVTTDDEEPIVDIDKDKDPIVDVSGEVVNENEVEEQ